MAILPIAVVLATLSLGLSATEVPRAGKEYNTRSFSSVLTVTNGQTWGEWKWREMCPDNTYAVGFSLRVEPSLGGRRDDTALNAIRLFCAKDDDNMRFVYTIESHIGYWGRWTKTQYCPSGTLISFQLRVEGKQGSGDDTAANNIKFRCTSNPILEGDGTGWGEYGGWSKECRNGGICGIETKMEKRQGKGDDTALNDVRFFCCSYSQK